MAYEFIQRWLSVDYLTKQPESSQTLIDMIRRMPADGYAATCAALRDADLDAAHISNWEQPSVFSDKVIEFLS